MPAVTPGDWLPLVVISAISNVSYTMQRYDKFPKIPNFLAIICVLFVIADVDIVAGLSKRIPGDVEPAVAGEELVGMLTLLEEFHQTPEPSRIFRSDVSRLTDEVLGIVDTANKMVHPTVAEA